jgi:AAA+ superfamily predicted ATPase
MTKGAGGEHSPVAPVDLSQAIIGPGMAVFSKYSAVLEANGSLMSVRTARHLVNSFSSIVWLECDLALLYYLRVEAREAMAEELRAADLRVTELRGAQAQPSSAIESSHSEHSRSCNGNASWDTLVIPQSLRENLQAYCRILRDYKAYQEVGVHLPKGLLFCGPPGCGKTQIAKTLATEAGLNFVALSTSDCKAMWIGQSADRLAAVFREARSKQRSLIFIDELDIVCPSRGLYHDCVSQEFTGELLQQLDGIASDADAIFLCGASNRPDQIDAAILSRFAEQIEIPLPDETARRALLEVFLGPMRFAGKRQEVILCLAQASQGKSGRDLRALVNQGVLHAVKRSSSVRDFALSQEDFALH